MHASKHATKHASLELEIPTNSRMIPVLLWLAVTACMGSSQASWHNSHVLAVHVLLCTLIVLENLISLQGLNAARVIIATSLGLGCKHRQSYHAPASVLGSKQLASMLSQCKSRCGMYLALWDTRSTTSPGGPTYGTPAESRARCTAPLLAFEPKHMGSTTSVLSLRSAASSCKQPPGRLALS